MFETLYRNTKLILLKLIRFNVGLFCVVSLCLLLLGKEILILSFGLGMSFSFLIFFQLLSSQEKILKKRNKNVFFPLYFLRLLLYAVPLSIAFLFKDDLNLGVIAISLLTFHATFITLELIKNIKRYRKRRASWIN